MFQGGMFGISPQATIKRMWLFDGQFLKSRPFADQDSNCIKKLHFFEKAHENVSNGVNHRTINTRAGAKRARSFAKTSPIGASFWRDSPLPLSKEPCATNGKHVPCTAAKDQQSNSDVGSIESLQKTHITTFAARGKDTQGKRSFPWGCFFWLLFLQNAKKVTPTKNGL